MQSFSHWGNGEESSPPAKNLLIPSPPRKISPKKTTPHQIFISTTPPLRTTKQQISNYNPIKTAFLAASVPLAAFLF